MNLDTLAVRRVRDHLMAYLDGQPDEVAGAAPVPPDGALLRRVEPLAETLYLVMMADGEPASEERRALSAAVNLLTGGRIAAPDLDLMLEGFAEGLRRDGLEGRIARLGGHLAADPQSREAAFVLAAAMVLADQRIDIGEHRVMVWVREYFGVSDRRMAALLESLR